MSLEMLPRLPRLPLAGDTLAPSTVGPDADVEDELLLDDDDDDDEAVDASELDELELDDAPPPAAVAAAAAAAAVAAAAAALVPLGTAGLGSTLSVGSLASALARASSVFSLVSLR
jgi:hypothetical protein